MKKSQRFCQIPQDGIFKMREPEPGGNKVQIHYDEIADVYDQRYDHRDRGKMYYDHISKAVLDHIRTDGTLLDIGCGTGLFLQRYLKYGKKAVGLDISPGMVRKACKKHPNEIFLIGTAEKLPFKDNSFTSISSLLTFSYLVEPENTLIDCLRVLEPGGRIAICTLGKNVFTSGLPAIYSIGEKMRIKRVGVGTFPEQYYSAKDMYQLLESAGFEDIEIFRCSFAHFNFVDLIFSIAKRVEPFIEERIPYLAYNLIGSGRKPASEVRSSV